MLEPFGALRRADQPAGAADIDLALLGHRLAAALRAVIGELVGIARRVSGQVLDHLRDDIARTLDRHAVAGAHPEPRDFVAVVQRHFGDHHAAHGDRGEPSDRGQLAGAADLDVDRFQSGLRLLGRELARDRPARGLGDEAEPLLPVEPVDLVDHPIDIIRQVGASLLDRAVVLQHLCSTCAAFEMRRNRHAPRRNPLHHRELRCLGNRRRRAPAMREKAQRTARGHARILLPQRPRRRIPRVGEDLIAALLLRCIERGKVLFRHINFAANFEQVGHFAAQHLRNIGNVRDIRRHVLAHLPVTASRGADQPPAFIAQRA